MTDKTLKELQEWAASLDVSDLLALSSSDELASNEKSFIYTTAKKLKFKDNVSFKALNWLYSILSRLNKEDTLTDIEINELSGDVSEGIHPSDIKHLCLRMAWHDNKWNGNICDKPDENIYCVGENSLLSDRIRKRRNIEKECASGCAGCPATEKNLGDYQPPCFWSINAFGDQELKFKHDNPVEPSFPLIEETLPPYSIISWPFKLSFTRDDSERDDYGSYYPKEIFESRINKFHNAVVENESLVFLYCKYSNPVSGEEMLYLTAGCALLSDKGGLNWFDVSEEELSSAKERQKQANFPSLNWALRYSIDFENTGVRLPYHEYLQMMEGGSGISEDLLQEIAVTISEPELRDGFTYVAKHVDDDQAIFLLMKIRKSILTVQDHDLCQDYDTDDALAKIELLLDHAWKKRGYFPGLKSLLLAIPSCRDNFSKEIATLINLLELADESCIHLLIEAIENEEFVLNSNLDSLLEEVAEFIDYEGLSAEEFLRLASMNLTANQFSRILNKVSSDSTLLEVSRNPYLLYEDYEPDVITEDKITGVKIDGYVDLFKIDLALFPQSKYLKKNKSFHSYKVSDLRRLRAVVLEILNARESSGDCYLDASFINKAVKDYPLFYKNSDEYRVKEDFSSLSEDALDHFRTRVVTRTLDGVVVYYLTELYDSEVYVADVVNTLLNDKSYNLSVETLTENIASSSKVLSDRMGQSFDAEVFTKERERLYQNIVNEKLYVLTGGAGSGKSYELMNVISYLRNKGEMHQVLTLTGKAALRLKNSDEGFTGINVQTIDKFLTDQRRAAAQDATSIVHNLIIDEASMVDLPKLSELLRYAGIDNNSFRRLILVGDENQLPPIGFGKPFADIIDYLKRDKAYSQNNFISLESNCRAELSNNFVDFTRLFSGFEKFSDEEIGDLDTEGSICDGGIELNFWRDKASLESKIRNNLVGILANDNKELGDFTEYLGIDSAGKLPPSSLDRLQILSPKVNGFHGVSGINLYFQDKLRSEESYLNSGGETLFKRSDKVMHTKNEYEKNDLFVSNGSMGSIAGNKKILFSELNKPTYFNQINSDALQLAYAISVHKSQGSGFENTVIVIPADSRFVTKELFYTALTRAKSKVVLLIQKPSSDYSVTSYIKSIQKNSAISCRRTSLLKEDFVEYGYSPAEGVYVKSRVEYIIYKKLQLAAKTSSKFSFKYEELYKLEDKHYDYHPDFVLHMDDGRTIYWEHLGKVTSPSYLRMWDKRKATYTEKGDLPNVLTTDELNGIDDEKIDLIIGGIVSNELETEDSSNRYSDMHFSLR